MCFPPDQVQDSVGKQPVVEHHVGALHEPQGTECKKIGIAGAGSNKIDFSNRRAGRTIRCCFKRPLKLLPCFVLMPCEETVGNGAFQHSLPEAPPQNHVVDARGKPFAISAGKGNEAPIGSRDHAFQPRADHAREYRRKPSRRNGNHQRIAIDDGWHDEVAQFGSVRDVDGNLGLFGKAPNRAVRFGIAGRAEDEGTVLNG